MSDSREQFEAWLTSPIAPPTDTEINRSVEYAWRAWQASRAQPERKLTDAEIDVQASISCGIIGGKLSSYVPFNEVCRFSRHIVRALLAAQPAAATVPDKPATSNPVEIDRKGACFWHANCSNHFGGVMMEVVHTKNSTLLKCLHCDKHAHYPVGGVGRICAEAVQPPAAQAQDDGEKQ